MKVEVQVASAAWVVLALVTFAQAEPAKRLFPGDYWELTRMSTVVAIGKVTRVDARVMVAVTKTLKGPVVVGQALEFPTPAVADDRAEDERQSMFVHRVPLRFAAGATWLLFLRGQDPTLELTGGTTGPSMGEAETAVRNVLRLDALPDERSKCRMLAELASLPKSFSSDLAQQELLLRHNRPWLFDLLEPVVTRPDPSPISIALLAANPHPRASAILRNLLVTEKDCLLDDVILALRAKAPEDAALSRELVPFLRHERIAVRHSALFALDYRNFREGYPEVVERLDDADPGVRSVALHWPWYQRADAHVVGKIRRLLDDPNDEVRAAACEALIGLRDIPSFYRLLAARVLDRSRAVRRSAALLDLLWATRPGVVSALLLWPSGVALLLFLALVRGMGARRMIGSAALGLGLGYVAGFATGYGVAAWDGGRLAFHALILFPPFFMPLGVLALGIVRARGRTPVTRS